MPVAVSIASRCLSLYSALMDHRVTFKIPRLLYKDFLCALLGERHQDQMLLSVITFRILRKAAIKTGVIGALAVLVRYYTNINSRVVANQKILTRLERANWQFYRLPLPDRIEILDAVFSATLITCRSGDAVDAQGALISKRSAGIKISNIKCIGYDALCAEYYILGSTNYIMKVDFVDGDSNEDSPSSDPMIHKLFISDAADATDRNFESTVLVEPVSFTLETPLLFCDSNFNVSLRSYNVFDESVEAYIDPLDNETKESIHSDREQTSENPPASHVSEESINSATPHSSALSDRSYYSLEEDDDYQASDSSKQSDVGLADKKHSASKITGQYNLTFNKFRRKLTNDRFFSVYEHIKGRYVALSNNAPLSGILLNFYDPMITREQIETLISSFNSLCASRSSSNATWTPVALRKERPPFDVSADFISMMSKVFSPHSNHSYLTLVQNSDLRFLDLAVSPSASHLNLLTHALFAANDMEGFSLTKEERDFYTELRSGLTQNDSAGLRFSHSIQLLLSSLSGNCSPEQISIVHRLASMLFVDAFSENNSDHIHYLGKTHEHLDSEPSKDRRRGVTLNLGPAAKMREDERIESRRALIERLVHEIKPENSSLVLKMLSDIRGGWFQKEYKAEKKDNGNEPARKRRPTAKQADSHASAENEKPDATNIKNRIPIITVFSFTDETELNSYIRFLEVQTFHYILSEIVAFYVSTTDNDNIYVHRSFSQQREKLLARYNPIFDLLTKLNTEYRMLLRETRNDFTASKQSMGVRFMPEHVGFLHKFPYYYWNMQTLPLQDITLAGLWSFMRIWGVLDPATSEAGDNFLDSPDGQYCGGIITSLIQELGIENPEFLNPAESDALGSDETHNSNSSDDESSKESEYIPTDATKRQLKRTARSRRRVVSDSSYTDYNDESNS